MIFLSTFSPDSSLLFCWSSFSSSTSFFGWRMESCFDDSIILSISSVFISMISSDSSSCSFSSISSASFSSEEILYEGVLVFSGVSGAYEGGAELIGVSGAYDRSKDS